MEEYGEKKSGYFLKNTDTNKWENLRSCIASKSEYGVDFLNFLFSKTGIFNLGLTTDSDDYEEYCQIISTLFKTYARVSASKDISSFTEKKVAHVVSVLSGLLNGLKFLCENDSKRDFRVKVGKIMYPMFLFICSMTRVISTRLLAQKLNKGLNGMCTEFVVALKPWKPSDFMYIEYALESNWFACYQNIYTIFLVYNPLSYHHHHTALLEKIQFNSKTDSNCLFQLLTRAVCLSKKMHDENDINKEEFTKTCKILEILPISASAKEEYFNVSLATARKLVNYSYDHEWLTDVIYKVIFPHLKFGKTVPNNIILHQTRCLEIEFSPIIPKSLKSISYSEEFYYQLDHIPSALKDPDSKLRGAAINGFQRWCLYHWSGMLEYCQTICIECLSILGLSVLDQGSVNNQIEALQFFQTVLTNNTKSHLLIGALLEGCNEYEDRRDGCIDISSCISVNQTTVRKEFVMLLRICNKIFNIKWNRICSLRKVFRQLLVEDNKEVEGAIVGLLKYNFFRVKDLNDKEGIMCVVKDWSRMMVAHGDEIVFRFIQALMNHFPTDNDKAVILAILRKFGHQIYNWVKTDTPNPPEHIVRSLRICCYIWRSKVDVKNSDESNKALYLEVSQLWATILGSIFARDSDDELSKIVICIAPVFRADTVDKISVPLRASFRSGHESPDVLLQSLVLWNKVGDLWSLITDWIGDFVRRPTKRSGVRFIEDKEQLDVKFIAIYLKCLCGYDTAFRSAACTDAAEYLFILEKMYITNIINKENKQMNKLTEDHLQAFLRTKFKIVSANDAVPRKYLNCEMYPQITIDSRYHESAEVFKMVQQIFKCHMQNMKNILDEPANKVISDDYEEVWLNAVVKSPKLVAPFLNEILNLFLSVLKYRVYQGKKDAGKSMFNILIEIIRNIIFKGERQSMLNFPEKPMSQLFMRISEDPEILYNSILDLLVDCIDIDLEFDSNPNSAEFLINLIMNTIGTATSVPKLAASFNRWYNERLKSGEDCEREKYLAEYIDHATEAKFSFSFLEHINFTKIRPMDKSLGLDNSNFDNDEPLLSVSKNSTFTSRLGA